MVSALRLWGQTVDNDNRFLNTTAVATRATTETTVAVMPVSDYMLLVDTSAGNTTVSLPDATKVKNRTFAVKRTTGGADTLTVSAVSGDIDGASSDTLVDQYACRIYKSDGVNYWIVSYYLT